MGCGCSQKGKTAGFWKFRKLAFPIHLGRFEFQWCYLCSSGFSPLSPHLCVSFWAGFQEKFPLAVCCVFCLHPDMPQHVQRKSLCLQLNLHKQNELCHHPLLWELFSSLHTLSLSYLELRVSLKKSDWYFWIFFFFFPTCKTVSLITWKHCLKWTHTHTPPKYQLCISLQRHNLCGFKFLVKCQGNPSSSRFQRTVTGGKLQV